jgi:arginyl-tRNA synthetase
MLLELIDALAQKAAAAVKAHFPDGAQHVGDRLPVERSNKADLQTAAALQLNKKLGRKPLEIAAVIAEALGADAAIAKAEVAGPGFVNLTVADAWLARSAPRALELRHRGQGQRVVIDYSAPNIAKPMHIGHIRSTIIGDAIKRVLRAVGYDVIADNHLGDWGTQFGKLIVAYRRWVDPAELERDPVAELLRLYIKFQDESKAKDDDELEGATPLLSEARAELVKLQQGDADNLALWHKFVDVSMREFERVYQRLGVSFDVQHGESFYNDQLAATVQRLSDDKIAEESQGALVVFFKKPDGSDEMPPAIVRKADGGYNYATTDVACMLYRQRTWDPARIIILTDERQQLHFRQLFAIARRLGVTCSLEHVWFGLMRLPEGTISTREGKLIHLEVLLDEAEKRALDIATQASPESPEAERREIARVVGIGAVKYNDLSKDRTTLVTFTWDKALSLSGNSGPYLQYAYARNQSILRKGRDQHGAEPGAIATLLPSERALLLKIFDFGAAVEAVAATTKPHLLCDYLYELAGLYSTFNSELSVLKADTPELRASRLELCALTASALKQGLGLLGIATLDRM